MLLWVWLGFVVGGGGGRSRVDLQWWWLWVSMWWWVCFGILGVWILLDDLGCVVVSLAVFCGR